MLTDKAFVILLGACQFYHKTKLVLCNAQDMATTKSAITKRAFHIVANHIGALPFDCKGLWYFLLTRLRCMCTFVVTVCWVCFSFFFFFCVWSILPGFGCYNLLNQMAEIVAEMHFLLIKDVKGLSGQDIRRLIGKYRVDKRYYRGLEWSASVQQKAEPVKKYVLGKRSRDCKYRDFVDHCNNEYGVPYCPKLLLFDDGRYYPKPAKHCMWQCINVFSLCACCVGSAHTYLTICPCDAFLFSCVYSCASAQTEMHTHFFWCTWFFIWWGEQRHFKQQFRISRRSAKWS